MWKANIDASDMHDERQGRSQIALEAELPVEQQRKCFLSTQTNGRYSQPKVEGTQRRRWEEWMGQQFDTGRGPERIRESHESREPEERERLDG